MFGPWLASSLGSPVQPQYVATYRASIPNSSVTARWVVLITQDSVVKNCWCLLISDMITRSTFKDLKKKNAIRRQDHFNSNFVSPPFSLSLTEHSLHTSHDSGDNKSVSSGDESSSISLNSLISASFHGHPPFLAAGRGSPHHSVHPFSLNALNLSPLMQCEDNLPLNLAAPSVQPPPAVELARWIPVTGQCKQYAPPN